jgi:hypothetical protein
VVRPPADTGAATWRLAIGLALFFALAPDARFGYFAYPGALLGWLLITGRFRRPAPGAAVEQTAPAAAAPEGAAAAETATSTSRAGTTEAVAAAAVPAQASTVPAWPVLAAAKAKVIRFWLRWRSRPATGNISNGR